MVRVILTELTAQSYKGSILVNGKVTWFFFSASLCSLSPRGRIRSAKESHVQARFKTEGSLVLFSNFRNEIRTIDFLDCNIVDAPSWTEAAF